MSSLSNAAALVHQFTKRVSLLTLSIGLCVLALWAFAPALAFRLMQREWVTMSPQAASGFCLLAAALLFHDSQAMSRMNNRVMGLAGALVCACIVAGLFSLSGVVRSNPLTYTAVFSLALALTASSLVSRHRSLVADALGAIILILIVGFIYFLVCYCHGVYSVLDGQIPCPQLLSVICTVLLSAAILGALGPGHFPAQLFIGPSIRAALLRKSLPVAIAVILIFVCVRGSMPAFLPAPLATFLTLMTSSSLVLYVVLKSSSVVGVQLEAALKESEQNYAQLVQGLKDHAVFLLSAKGEILVWNPGAELITGYPASEVLGQQVSHLFTSTDPGFDLAAALDQVRLQGSGQLEGWAGRKYGPPFWAETSLSRLVDGKGKMIGMSVIIRDATERRQSEESMRRSLQEKEVMLKEIHHRVKNNLQVISSLLRLQSEAIPNQEAAALFLDSQVRVRAMAMVHEQLYQSPDLARIDFPAYVKSLVGNLYRTFSTASSHYPPTIDIEDARLSLDLAVPCGLLLSELVSNAVKYAYPGNTGGPIDVRFRKLAEGRFEMSVTDQGVGFPKGFDWAQSASLGLRLVRLLTEQLHGQILLENHHGTKFTVTFGDMKEGTT